MPQKIDGFENRLSTHGATGGTRYSVRVPLLDLRLSAEVGGGLATQLLRGEVFTVYRTLDDGQVWGQSECDGYVGHVAAAGLGPYLDTTHRITALKSHVYSQPKLKSPVLSGLPFMAGVSCGDEYDGYARLSDGGFIPLRHIGPVEGDFVDHARRFLGTPYLWGGRSAEGLDCSALVQLSMMAAGLDVPRDSDMQESFFADASEPDDDPQRGDLVFWDGHVGIISGPDTLLHCNAYHMATVEEPFGAAVQRIASGGYGRITSMRRPVLPTIR